MCELYKQYHCSNCPIRKQAMQQPQSIFARIHRWHSHWWPGWKAYQGFLMSLRTKAQAAD